MILFLLFCFYPPQLLHLFLDSEFQVPVNIIETGDIFRKNCELTSTASLSKSVWSILLIEKKTPTKTTEKYCYPPQHKKRLNRVFHLVQFEIWLYINLSVNKMFITEFTISIRMMHYSIYWFILSFSFSVFLSINCDFFLFYFLSVGFYFPFCLSLLSSSMFIFWIEFNK